MRAELQYALIAAFAYSVAAWNILMMLLLSREGGQRHGYDPARLAWAACLITGASAFLIRIPAIYTAIDTAAGVVNLSILFIDLLFLACALCMHLWIVHWPGQVVRRTHRRVVAATVLVMLTLVVLFFLAPRGVERPTDFETAYLHQPLVAAYNALYLIAFAAEWPLAAFACRSARRDARRISYRPLVLGLVFLEAGMWLAFLYAAGQAGYVLGIWTHNALLTLWAIPAGNLFASLSPCSSVTGSTCRTWGPRVVERMDCSGVSSRLTYRRLRPLHHLVAGYDPHDPAPQRLTTANWDKAVAQRTVQILDGLSALAAYRDGALAARAGLAADRERAPAWPPQAFVEACVILGAVQAHREGHEPDSHPLPRQETLAEATAWLNFVAAALPAARRARGV